MLTQNVRRLLAPGSLAIAIAPGLNAGPALASTATGTVAVAATVLNVCTVATGSLRGSQTDGPATIIIACTNGTSEAISLDNGQNTTSATGGFSRAQGFLTNYLNYEIYKNSSRSTVWNTGGGAVAATGTGLPQTMTAYARNPAGQLRVPAGTYIDTINVTVTY